MVGLAYLPQLELKIGADEPLYRQVADALAAAMRQGEIAPGERLPATRELAEHLSLNRATISAAYAVLEQAGLLAGQVGRGSFAVGRRPAPDLTHSAAASTTVAALAVPPASSAHQVEVNFSSSRPDEAAFPIAAVQALAHQVIDSPELSDILQLGSSYGYAPLRRYLLEEALAENVAGPSDDLLITNGCQQGLDLLARIFTPATVALEDPCYHGLLRAFARSGCSILPVPVTGCGLDLQRLEQLLQRQQPKLVIVTPSFQNPTGATLPLADRRRLLRLAETHKFLLVENDIYSQLRYAGSPLPSLKELDESGQVILLRSYSKVAFPGLRVGWVVARRELIARLAEEKQIADLHSDQLAQAVLLQFARSGELQRHLERTRAAGADRLRAILQACGRYLPPGSLWTQPEGGMSLWVELPGGLRADELLRACRKQGVDFLPGSHFSPTNGHPHALRLSFGGLSPERIELGLEVLGAAAAAELTALEQRKYAEPAMALV